MTFRYREPLSIGERLSEVVDTFGDGLLGLEPGDLALAPDGPGAPGRPRPTLRAVAVSSWRAPGGAHATAGASGRCPAEDRGKAGGAR
jgi:hypothetical protein